MSLEIVFLYRKTHNKTGLKYIGITKKNPFKYAGSGEYWVKHLKKHGNDVTTEILHKCTVDNVKEWGIHYSKLYNIVESKEYANMKPETGYGGTGMTGKKQSEETKLKIGSANKGFKFSEESLKKMSESHKGMIPANKGAKGLHYHSDNHKKYLSEIYSGDGNPFSGKEHSKEFIELQRERQKSKVVCPYCNKSGASRIMKRWHFDNCKEKYGA
jgi:uncharacterized Zn-finger protein